ncbi:MAG: BolA family protein [Thiotrichales bacterium]
MLASSIEFNVEPLMSMQQIIEQKLTATFAPVFVEVLNESHMHSVPPGSESHFKVTVVADQFQGLPLIKQHRLVNQALSGELTQIHALALHTYTPEIWFERAGKTPDSPLCHGGSKA